MKRHITVQEYGEVSFSSVWSPYRKADMEDIENVQKRATKLIPELKHMNYIDRLKKMSAANTTLPKNARRHE